MKLCLVNDEAENEDKECIR